jgi:hypothetical protein
MNNTLREDREEQDSTTRLKRTMEGNNEDI